MLWSQTGNPMAVGGGERGNSSKHPHRGGHGGQSMSSPCTTAVKRQRGEGLIEGENRANPLLK